MNLNALLAALSQLGVQLWVDGDQLCIGAPKGVLTAELHDLLAGSKAELLSLLRQKNKAASATFIPLAPVPRDGDHPLSFAQQRLWFLDQLEGGSATYNMPDAVRLSGPLHVEALEQSLTEIVRRHEVLRTTFPMVNGVAVQVIAPTLTLTLPVVDLQALPEVEQSAEVQRLTTEEAKRPFDLANRPLLRVTLLRLGSESHVLLLTMHHIVSDRWSLGIFIRELSTLYEAFSQGSPSPLPELPIQYADFACWQRQWLQGSVLETQLNYWKQQLVGAPPLLELPTDRPRPALQTFRGAMESFVLPKTLTEGLRALSRQEGVTLFMTLLAAFKTLLYRYTGREDIIVGTDIAGRNRTELEGLIGFFVNLLILRTALSGNPSFRELLDRVRKVALGAYAHQDLPFEKLVEALRPERNLSHTPLVQVLFVLQNAPMPILELSGLTLSPLKTDNGTSKFDLALFMEETEQGLVGTWNYNTDLFDPTTITRMSGHFETILGSIVSRPDARLNTLEMLTETEMKQQAREKSQRQESKLKKLRSARRKAVNLSEVSLIKTDCLQPGETLPLVVQPAVDKIDLVEWANSNREFIETKLLKHGAILFRGFNVDSVSEFEQLAMAICPELLGEYGDLPREGVSGKIYSSTPYPPEQAILFHNESSHLHRWPMKLFFFCIKAAQQGGETPIVDCRKVYDFLNSEIREQFRQKKIMYVRNFIERLDVSWQAFFRTTDKSVVEDYCRNAFIDFECKDGNGLRTRKVNPAVAKHPNTGEMVFFNQLQLHHVACLEPAVRESLLSLFKEEELPRNVYYGDGSPIETFVLNEVRDVYQQEAVTFTWQEGDILMLDNMLTAHGRNPFVGSRKLVVAMGEMSSDGNIQHIDEDA